MEQLIDEKTFNQLAKSKDINILSILPRITEGKQTRIKTLLKIVGDRYSKGEFQNMDVLVANMFAMPGLSFKDFLILARYARDFSYPQKEIDKLFRHQLTRLKPKDFLEFTGKQLESLPGLQAYLVDSLISNVNTDDII